jgi:hypothetical protein
MKLTADVLREVEAAALDRLSASQNVKGLGPLRADLAALIPRLSRVQVRLTILESAAKTANAVAAAIGG